MDFPPTAPRQFWPYAFQWLSSHFKPAPHEAQQVLSDRIDDLAQKTRTFIENPYSKSHGDSLCNYYSFLLSADAQAHVWSDITMRNALLKQASLALIHPSTTIPCGRIIRTVIEMFTV